MEPKCNDVSRTQLSNVHMKPENSNTFLRELRIQSLKTILQDGAKKQEKLLIKLKNYTVSSSSTKENGICWHPLTIFCHLVINTFMRKSLAAKIKLERRVYYRLSKPSKLNKEKKKLHRFEASTKLHSRLLVWSEMWAQLKKVAAFDRKKLVENA